MKRIGPWLALLIMLGVLAIVVVRDPAIQRAFSSGAPVVAVGPTPPLSPRPVGPAPDFAQAYADAFCRADAAYLAAHTQIAGIDEGVIANYLAGNPPCTGVKYLGDVNDDGQYRYIFVLTFDARQDWLVFTMIHDDRNGLVVDLRRG